MTQLQGLFLKSKLVYGIFHNSYIKIEFKSYLLSRIIYIYKKIQNDPTKSFRRKLPNFIKS